MAGWLSVRRVPRERRAAPLRGYKLAYPAVSADGARAGFVGVSLGRSHAYGVTADAVCAQGSHHRRPGRWCGCGFYCFHTVDDARAAACEPEYRRSVLLEVEASGRYVRYEKGLRYARQRVTAVRVGRCECGRRAWAFVDSGGGLPGWLRLVPACAACAGQRPTLSVAGFARLLGGGARVVHDDGWEAAGREPVVREAVPEREREGEGERQGEPLPLLFAEVAVLHARLDQLQSQVDRLTGGR